MKKIIKFLMLMILVGTSFINKSSASTYQDSFLKTYDKVDGVYVTKLGQKKYYDYMYIIVKASDKQFVYCIEPGMSINEKALYNGYTSDYLSLSKLTAEQWDRIQRLAYYGYGYVADGIDHSDKKWYAVTQYMIWQTAPNGYDIFFTDRLQGNKINLYANEMAEMERIIAEHNTKPNFSNIDSNMTIGNTQVLTDNNNVLSKYEVSSSNNNVSVTKSGNNLYITANQSGSAVITLSKNSNKFNTPPIVFTAENTQRILQAGNIDPIRIHFDINVSGGNVTIQKVDSETNGSPQGSATLNGAKYNVYDSNRNYVTTLTTNSNGIASSGNILSINKTYYIKEVEASNGYLLDTNEYSFSLDKNNLTKTIIVKEQVIKGKIKIVKHDTETNSCNASGMATLKGAKYEIRDKNNSVVDTLTIGNDCSATSKSLPYGKYTIKEISAPTGYYIDSKTYSVDLKNNNEVVSITSKDEVIKGRIKINKIDSETKTCKPLGQASLVGAKFNIKDYNNKVVDTLTIGNDCTAISKYLPYGKYKIEEIESSKGYYINSEVFNVFIEQKLDYSVTVKEDVIKNYISILKQYDYVDGNTTFLNAEANITFEIYYPDGTKYDEITTDKNGYATISIPYGIWKFHQVNTNTGFEKIYDFYITVDENSEKEHYYNILNNKLSAYLKVVKIDKETGKVIALPNTKFKILNTDTNKYISQYVGGKVYDTFYTDETGTFTTYLKLEAGNYRLVEIESPSGYLIDKDGVDFTIGDDSEYHYTTYGTFVVVDFENTAIKGQVEIYKSGEKFVINNGMYKYDSILLDNIKYELYADEDIKTPDGNYLYYNKGDLVEVLITDKYGYAISKKLPLGKYFLVETETKDNYILDTKEYHFELTEKDNKTAIVYDTYKAFNYLEKGKLEFTKTDLVDGKVISNVKIKIYNINDELVYSGITDENGKVIIDNLFVGKYYIVEEEAATGYILNEEKVYFEIKENGKVVKASMTNEKIKGNVEFTKIDSETKEVLQNATIIVTNDKDEIIYKGTTDKDGKVLIEDLEYGKYKLYEFKAPEGYILNNEVIEFEIRENKEVIKLEMSNDKIKGTLEFTKTDLVDGKALPNVKVEIYNVNDELIYSGITDKDGKIKIDNLKYGKYYIIEKETLTNYVLTTEKVYFEIKENNEIVKASMTNEKIKSLITIYKVDTNNNYISGVEIGIYDSNDNLIGTYITNEKGYIEVELEYGEYYYKELKTVEGLILNDEKVNFSVIQNDTHLEFTLINEIEEIEIPNTIKFDYTKYILAGIFFIGIICMAYAFYKNND